MSRGALAGLDVFLAVAEHGSLRAAAAALDVQPPAVSQQLKAFEQALGVRLFVRTTRSVRLTDPGRALLQRARPAMSELATALDEARGAANIHRGTLRISMPWIGYRLVMAEAMAAFQARYPEIELELSLDEAFADIVADGYHAGIRMGDRVQGDMIAMRLTPPLEEVCFAAPSYLERHGRPRELEDLLRHNCIRYRFQGSRRLQEWQFDGPDGKVEVGVRGNLIVNSFTAVVQAARDGVGIGKFFRADVESDLAAGTLEAVLERRTFTYPGFFLYYPRDNARLALLRAFVDFLKTRNAVD